MILPAKKQFLCPNSVCSTAAPSIQVRRLSNFDSHGELFCARCATTLFPCENCLALVCKTLSLVKDASGEDLATRSSILNERKTSLESVGTRCKSCGFFNVTDAKARQICGLPVHPAKIDGSEMLAFEKEIDDRGYVANQISLCHEIKHILATRGNALHEGILEPLGPEATEMPVEPSDKDPERIPMAPAPSLSASGLARATSHTESECCQTNVVSSILSSTDLKHAGNQASLQLSVAPQPTGRKKNRRRKRVAKNAKQATVDQSGAAPCQPDHTECRAPGMCQKIQAQPTCPSSDATTELASHALSRKRTSHEYDETDGPKSKRAKLNNTVPQPDVTSGTSSQPVRATSVPLTSSAGLRMATMSDRELEKRLFECRNHLTWLHKRLDVVAATRRNWGERAFTRWDYELLELSYKHSNSPISRNAKALLLLARSLTGSPHPICGSREEMLCAGMSLEQTTNSVEPVAIILNTAYRSSVNTFKKDSLPFMRGLGILNEELNEVYDSLLFEAHEVIDRYSTPSDEPKQLSFTNFSDRANRPSLNMQWLKPGTQIDRHIQNARESEQAATHAKLCDRLMYLRRFYAFLSKLLLIS
ncbi:uncharacterized protein SPPG_01876 [Spizellomyces punctatus DAOM BR117]|uniref:Uncharacterized protein n=1 Tax=Spizellomyces punctatus (strain DAOM BR117) TaxID=645134 RepID=A0A0L0HP99_SPIPD|nr:uncharacterized protein SPPG_01876 [Spizellomyces punctatus DAOM BR117]KND02795.1 hypothetical protein SPPG_01876 [Spizellomyces punctatus DAOM BR117]|eukprot:XP_016610834.1 hypothetical protein SPPG_01876 [Spizellomyces punctatus DAOM BR117]